MAIEKVILMTKSIKTVEQTTKTTRLLDVFQVSHGSDLQLMQTHTKEILVKKKIRIYKRENSTFYGNIYDFGLVTICTIVQINFHLIYL